MFNTESVYFRTEGDLSNVSRSNGIQVDAGRNATGTIGLYGAIAYENQNGSLFVVSPTSSQTGSSTGLQGYNGVVLDLAKQWNTANEFRVRNRLIRIYKLLTINGKKVSDIIGA